MSQNNVNGEKGASPPKDEYPDQGEGGVGGADAQERGGTATEGGTESESVSAEGKGAVVNETETSAGVEANEIGSNGETEGLLSVETEMIVFADLGDDSQTEREEEEEKGGKERRAEEEEDGPISDKTTGAPIASVSSITFHDLGYEVGQRKCFKRLPNKTILHSVRSVGSLPTPPTTNGMFIFQN